MSNRKPQEVSNETISFKSCSKLNELKKETDKVSKSVSEAISKLSYISK